MRRGIKEVKVDEIIDAKGLEEKHHIAQVNPLDLWNGVVFQFVLIGPCSVQPEDNQAIRI